MNPTPPARYAEVAFAIPTRQWFTYQVPQRWQSVIQPGCRVVAPLGNQTEQGFVARLLDEPPGGIKSPIKPIKSLLDEEPLFDEDLMRLLHWTADYYLASFGETCAVAYPFSVNAKPRMVKVVALDDGIRERGEVPENVRFENQRKVLEFLINRKALLSPSDLAREVGVSPSTLKTLQKKGLVHLQNQEVARIPVFSSQEASQRPSQLTQEQQEALQTIRQALNQSEAPPILLQGVTGSGKTEVYLQAIEDVLVQGKTALVLVPEISLTPQTMDRFKARFGDAVGILNSALGQGERYDEWRMAKAGQRSIIIGTRSAIFAPLPQLGMIIVDEEHDGSYKQADPSPRYHARDLAVVRAQLSGALCILGSATPSVESAHNARKGKYTLIQMQQRIAHHGMPSIELVDMRGRSEEEEILSNEMLDALWERLEQGRQSILFLNRRGFSTTLSCNHCGHVITCRHCTVPMVFHRSVNQLICHHCDSRQALPDICPACSETFIRMRGFGTEKVVAELEEKLPGVRVIRLDRDSTRRKGDHDRLLHPFRQGKADILVGTQMVAKGLDFPNVTLVGIINADYALALPDFRAAERTYALVTQVAGRSGRGEHPGEVVIQTYSPDHYSIQLALQQDYESFYQREIRYRQLIGFPPFNRLVLWRIEGKSEDITRDKAWELYSILQQGLAGQSGVTLLPPVEAPLYRLRDHYRWQVALKSQNHKIFRPLLQSDAIQSFFQRRVRFRIVQDVDPYDML